MCARREETALVRWLGLRARARGARRDVQPPAVFVPGEDADPGAVGVRLDDGLDLARSFFGHDHRLVDDQIFQRAAAPPDHSAEAASTVSMYAGDGRMHTPWIRCSARYGSRSRPIRAWNTAPSSAATSMRAPSSGCPVPGYHGVSAGGVAGVGGSNRCRWKG